MDQQMLIVFYQGELRDCGQKKSRPCIFCMSFDPSPSRVQDTKVGEYGSVGDSTTAPIQLGDKPGDLCGALDFRILMYLQNLD